jgi:hypothetical protein
MSSSREKDVFEELAGAAAGATVDVPADARLELEPGPTIRWS